MSESLDVKLARFEERLSHLESLMQDHLKSLGETNRSLTVGAALIILTVILSRLLL